MRVRLRIAWRRFAHQAMTVGGAAVTFGPAAVLVVLSREGHFDNCPLAHQFLIDCGESRSRGHCASVPAALFGRDSTRLVRVDRVPHHQGERMIKEFRSSSPGKPGRDRRGVCHGRRPRPVVATFIDRIIGPLIAMIFGIGDLSALGTFADNGSVGVYPGNNQLPDRGLGDVPGRQGLQPDEKACGSGSGRRHRPAARDPRQLAGQIKSSGASMSRPHCPQQSLVGSRLDHRLRWRANRDTLRLRLRTNRDFHRQHTLVIVGLDLRDIEALAEADLAAVQAGWPLRINQLAPSVSSSGRLAVTVSRPVSTVTSTDSGSTPGRSKRKV